MQQIAIYPRDPIVARDGRPFGRGAGNRMYSMDWPYPSVVAGSLRTMLGKEMLGRRDAFDDGGFLEELRNIRVRGPLPWLDSRVFLPRPRNFLRSETGGIERLQPMQLAPGCGVDLPGVLPLTPSMRAKPDLGHPLWSQEMLAQWLSGGPFSYNRSETREYPQMEERVHVEIDAARGVAAEGDLFSTQGLDFGHKSGDGPGDGLIISVTFPDGKWQKAMQKALLVHPLGGERRLALWQPLDRPDPWAMPSELADSLVGAKRVCMYVATPAVYAGGWRPGWLDAEQLTGTVPGTELVVKLWGAAVGRWQAVSGWSYELGGPKPVRRLVPAGSVYFFEVQSGDATALQELWLQSLSDETVDANDGFGLVCWGVWGRN